MTLSIVNNMNDNMYCLQAKRQKESNNSIDK